MTSARHLETDIKRPLFHVESSPESVAREDDRCNRLQRAATQSGVRAEMGYKRTAVRNTTAYSFNTPRPAMGVLEEMQ
jgi:hypothetical protein